ncbi:MAG: RluA family pseudouridine synthase [Burkholderiaceae bacterium]|jgi:23S rRNA pseudouridine1911/1915/1917 synthase|nr:RluA family pseudouridine synthase [Burkholderiales bacterium]MCZ8340034.1 RluA family pseudouridine synthase [Burkholderiaceae bacterium]
MQIHPDDYSEGGAADAALADGDAPQDAEGAVAPLRLDARAGAGQRLDRFLASAIDGVSRTRIQRWIALGAVAVDGAPALPGHRLRGLESIEAWPLPTEAERAFEPDAMPLAVVHEDADLMVIDKPAGLVVHPAPGHWRGTLMNGLLHARPDSAKLPRAGIVHRLDKDTSGLMMVARSEGAFERLTAALAARTVVRRYLAVVEGVPPPRFTVDAPIGRDPRDRLRMAVVAPERGRPAVTHVERLASVERAATLECRLETGRTHQIRVHLAHRGHPLVGDALYGGRTRAGFARQALHAWRLELEHPASGAPMAFASPLPDDLVALLVALGLPPPVQAGPGGRA